MGVFSLSRPRTQLVLLIMGILITGTILTAPSHRYWGTFGGEPLPPPPPPPPHVPPRPAEDILFDRLAIIFPINNNTDMQFYRNTWMRSYLHPVCDWDEPGCKIVCNRTSTYRTLDQKTFCFTRAIKNYRDTEFFIKLDDDSFVDKDYVADLLKTYSGWQKPVYISDHTRLRGYGEKDPLRHVRYGNGKFYMFNDQLVRCVDTDYTYEGSRNEDAVFGAMVTSGCGEENVEYIQEDDNKIWHKKYESKNKYIDLAHIKNH
ncbi:hypothetical protein H4217_003261 [Coemansia sp. RSA 1939]|nr:hypothetical protein H4217_003261 [Coemansia sp. RSA 1939]KAJ2615662.1 hypothetical protein EV177_001468 [Coemansia sp. RSA 1804]KAJ2693192.1 hypothetical protein GGH99_001282 [Coemansia sp. RSA 1285]